MSSYVRKVNQYTMSLTKEKVVLALKRALTEIEDEVLRARIEKKLISPYSQIRVWEWQYPEQEYETWLIARTGEFIGEHEVGIAFAEEGFGKIGSPWGLVSISYSVSGSSNCWYKSLEACIRDSGWFE
jgi:hypothetical protein